MQNVIAAAKRTSMKKAIMAAYEEYAADAPGAMDRLLELVRKFAYSKVYHLEKEFRTIGTSETADDWAQDMTLKIWQLLTKGGIAARSEDYTDAETFYNVVHRASFNQAIDGFHHLDDQLKNKVSLTVPSGEEDGEDEETDNPEIYRGGAGYSDSSMADIPSDLQGLDLDIVRVMMEGNDLTYEEIGKILGVAEKTIRNRTYKMRKRYGKEADD